MLRVKFAVAWETRGFCEALKADSDDTKKQAACTVANLAHNKSIRKKITSSDLGSILQGLGEALNDANASDDTKECAARAVGNLALNKAIREEIEKSGYLDSILEGLSEALKSTCDETKRQAD